MNRNLNKDIEFCRTVVKSHSLFLNTIAVQPDAKIKYHDFAEAIYWSDELPANAIPEIKQCFLILISLRGLVIWDESNSCIDEFFQEIRLVTGNWSLLCNERFADSLQEVFKEMYERAGIRMADEFERFERRNRR